jgi:PKD repeat protein
VGDTVIFTGSVTSGTLPVVYTWAFGDGATGAGSVVPHTYAASGVYTAVMTATNCASRISSVATRAITVTECPVKADFAFEPATPRTGELVTFTGVLSAGTAILPVTTTWEFGDGSPPLAIGVDDVVDASVVVTHAFPLATAVRTYTVTMGIADVCASSLLVQKGITVQPYSLYLPAILREEL